MTKSKFENQEKSNHEHLVDTKMTRKYLAFSPSETVERIENVLDFKAREFETIGYVYAIDENGILVGVASLKQILQSKHGTQLKEIMNTNVISLKQHEHQERAVYVALKHGLKVIPVVDSEHRLLGVVTQKSILSIFHHEFRKNLFRTSGIKHVKEIESMDTPVFSLVKVRFPSLFIGMIGGLIAASIVTNFEHVLTSYIALASFIPVIVYLTDAIGTQSQTLVVRLLAMEPGFPISKYVLREIKIGIILGFIFAAMLFVAEIVGWQQIKLGIVVGMAVFFSMIFQAFFSTYLSIALSRMKKDPAIASGPIATIISDVTTIAMYFAIAMMILQIF
ncbi:MAG: magnesium transporter [Candidatus Nitrosotenuis sp.]